MHSLQRTIININEPVKYECYVVRKVLISSLGNLIQFLVNLGGKIAVQFFNIRPNICATQIHLILQRREGMNQNKNIKSAFTGKRDIDLTSNYQSGSPYIAFFQAASQLS